jgi:hypothetical protein
VVGAARCLSRSRTLALAGAAGTATSLVAALLVRGVGVRARTMIFSIG